MSRMQERLAAARITASAGIAFINQNVPGGVANIKSSALDISSRCNCALAQATNGDYFAAADHFDLPYEEQQRLGFMDSDNHSFDMLTLAFKRELAHAA